MPIHRFDYRVGEWVGGWVGVMVGRERERKKSRKANVIQFYKMLLRRRPCSLKLNTVEMNRRNRQMSFVAQTDLTLAVQVAERQSFPSFFLLPLPKPRLRGLFFGKYIRQRRRRRKTFYIASLRASPKLAVWLRQCVCETSQPRKRKKKKKKDEFHYS